MDGFGTYRGFESEPLSPSVIKLAGPAWGYIMFEPEGLAASYTGKLQPSHQKIIDVLTERRGESYSINELVVLCNLCKDIITRRTRELYLRGLIQNCRRVRPSGIKRRHGGDKPSLHYYVAVDDEI